jgi:hypothetical protein
MQKMITDDKKNPDRDCMLVEMCKFPNCSTPYVVAGDVRTFIFYKHLNPNGFLPSFIFIYFLLLYL